MELENKWGQHNDEWPVRQFGVQVPSAFIFWQMLDILVDNSLAFIGVFQGCLPPLFVLPNP